MTDDVDDGWKDMKKMKRVANNHSPLHLKSLCHIILFYLFYGTNHNLKSIYLHVCLPFMKNILNPPIKM